jgi:hypothetical protein
VLQPDARALVDPLPEAARLLFLPRSGTRGIGEYVRCLTLAQAFVAAHPAARVWFAVRDALPRLSGDTFERLPLPRDAAQRERLDAILRELRPHLFVTNNRGRQRELEQARARGAGVVAIFSTGRRSRARRLDVLRSVDQLWIVPGEGRAGARAPSRLARLVSGRPHCEIVETLHPLPDAVRAEALRRRLGLEGEPYLLFAAGGGGWHLDGQPAAEVFAAAAARVAREGARAVVIAGPLHAGAVAAPAGVTALGEVEPSAMVDLVAGATGVVSAGGGLLQWVLSLGRPCVTTPMPCEDQRQRTAACRAQGTAWVVDGTASALADGALSLWRDAPRRDALVRRLAEVGPHNALPRCVALLEQLLCARRGGADAC